MPDSQEQPMTNLDPSLKAMLLDFQKNEISEHHIYLRLAQAVRQPENRRILEQIAADELRHYHEWKEYTRTEVKPDRWQIFKYTLISRLFGFTFGIKLMERGEAGAQAAYDRVREHIPAAAAILHEEEIHEQALMGMLDEELLRYIGSIVLGLNDALVELTGALAGFTLALQDARLIALTGSITGIAAALSMAASEYLSTKTEDTGGRNPLRAAFYTGLAYILTVLVLIAPYLLLANFYLSLAISLTCAVLIIACFNYYLAVAKEAPFRRRFLEMAGLSLGIAAFSFLVGFLLRQFFGVEV
jgi:VIT1/CCC1 family predicted Fe2+/Mn2+ transporter